MRERQRNERRKEMKYGARGTKEKEKNGEM
jgi:hypothetical protein